MMVVVPPLGLVVRPGSTDGGEVPRRFLYVEVSVTKELSIFVDESGDFGAYEAHSPFYFFTLVFHDQANSIDQQINLLETRLSNCSMPASHCFHAGPIIRREEDYLYMSIEERRHLLGLLVAFARSVRISYTTFCVEKKHINDSLSLTITLSRQLSVFIQENYAFFQSFDRIIVYYDNGQVELNRLLASVFGALLSEVEFRKVLPSEYRLFQVADLMCTLELTEHKAARKSLSNSELQFFGSLRDMNKNYLKQMHRLRFVSKAE